MGPNRREVILAAAALAPAAALTTARPAPVLAADAPAGAVRLVTFRPLPGMEPRVGVVLDGGRLIDVGAEASRAGKNLPFDPRSDRGMLALITAGPAAIDAVRLLAETATASLDLAAVQLLAPIPAPARNVYAVGWNYLEHFAEGQAAHKTNVTYPEHPVFFAKASHTINGPYDPIPYDAAVSTMVDWEGELAVVIGKRGRNIPEAEAMYYVFGYSVINDTTARDVQYTRHGGQWFKGKSLDGHGPMGPCIVVAGSLDPHDLTLTTRVNGVEKQKASTAQMYFKVGRIIAELSLGLTLEPGDIIASGTPSGVGYARKPQEFLKPGDVMETEISGIGLIRNEIKAV